MVVNNRSSVYVNGKIDPIDMISLTNKESISREYKISGSLGHAIFQVLILTGSCVIL